jgi:hypothetical protein
MANHAGTVVILDVNAEPGRAVGAGAAIRLVRDRWRWRTAGGSRARTGPVAAGFVGTTAQGEAIALDAGADRSLRYAFRFRPACPVLAALPHQSDFDTTTIHTTRRFHDSFTDAFDPDGNPRPVVAGRPRRLLLTTAVTFDGRLVSRSLARGTLRERVAVMDRDAFPGGGVLDACDTGPLPWQVARLF